MHEQPFQDVGMSSKMDPSHPARLAHVRERPLQHLPATPQEPTASLPADPAPVGIHGVASRLLLLPAPAPPVRLRDVAAQTHRRHRLVAVIALYLSEGLHGVVSWSRAGRREHRLHLLGRRDQRLNHRRRVARVGALHRYAHHRAGLQVHRMLGLVGQVLPPVFHLRDPRIRIVRMGPFGVRRLLLAGSVEPRQLGPRRRRNARRLGQPRQERRVVLARLAADDAAQRRIRLQRRRVDAHRLPRTKPASASCCSTQVNTASWVSTLSNRRVREIVEWSGGADGGARRRNDRRLNESAARHAIARSESRPSKYPTSSSRKIPARRQTRPPHPRIERRAQLLNEGIEAGRVQNLVQPLVEGMPAALGQVRRRHPHRLLEPVVAGRAHRHGPQSSTEDRSCRSRQNRLSPQAARPFAVIGAGVDDRGFPYSEVRPARSRRGVDGKRAVRSDSASSWIRA